MSDSDVVTIDAEQLDKVSGGSPLTKAVSNRLWQIWGNKGTVSLLPGSTFEGGNGGWMRGAGRFTVFKGPGGTEERSWVANLANRAVTKIRTAHLGWRD